MKEANVCKCGVLEQASREPDHAVRWNERLNEYYIDCGAGGHMMVHYCPFCGGSAPKSRRRLLFHSLTDGERERLFRLTSGIRSLHEMIATLGEPDSREPLGRISITPERNGEPEVTTGYPCALYSRLSDAADVHVTIYPNERVGFSFQGKRRTGEAG